MQSRIVFLYGAPHSGEEVRRFYRRLFCPRPLAVHLFLLQRADRIEQLAVNYYGR